MITRFQAADNEADRVSDRGERPMLFEVFASRILPRSQQELVHREYLPLYTLFARVRNYRIIV